MAQKKIKQMRLPSSGSLTLFEAENGELGIRLQMDEQEGTDAELVQRIHSAIAGLAYHYEHNSDEVDSIGLAFINGMKLASRNQPPEPTEKKKDKKGLYSKQAAGFHAEFDE